MKTATAAAATAGLLFGTNSFVASFGSSLASYESRYRSSATTKNPNFVSPLSMSPPSSADTDTSTEKTSFIETELRGAAMKLHTRAQAPKEGKAPEQQKREPYKTTSDDYLAFLVDSQHVYKAIEDVVNDNEELAVFRNSPLDRVVALDADIDFMVKEYNLEKPSVGKAGQDYASVIRELGNDGSVPEFLCHYYNFYFAHTAGGRMIGKQMSALLLDKKTLEFYKWDRKLNEIKDRVKGDIEDLVAPWSAEEKKRCTDQTMAAFRGGGSLNGYLAGGQSHH
uniref:Uncharacterized protein n=1 Tax=Pseudo-nitzschia australis TaxID=44445 RepID=A0A7S4AHD4_9STRA|mmetsp:Transcript_27526/g.60576  ORF Transcript_27526/g.60576 Transcript_27526/m.60576 type:complete len:281 (+) Transcript_27526:252-1094(+)|eukprot:CAMPEP_0168175090 /NCGR_PEP_ID=MMETSP0139_2-20121125/6911_1 /TAXON_ID=44445 /ORGANISM="Pseudo-nitzschia australis, Strain 10249 10 AB" /LENGTH=280 /DNA_ID=CAMNT_0008093403 /DNA_START=793 /DNA_END=1635 /DNA_ORIENTATION=-